MRRFTWFGQIARTTSAIHVPADSPYQTIDDLLAADRLRWATTAGSNGHLASALISEEFGIDPTYVFYEGYRELPVALMRGDADVACITMATGGTFVEAGDIRFLTTTTKERNPIYPEVPSGTESGLGFITPLGSSDFIIGGPPGVPNDIASMLTDAFRKSTEDEDLIAWSKRAKRPLYWLPPENVAEILEEGFPLFEPHIEFLK
jgi:tripartite-type tricarboxylate transporter receptor subunit TctC